VELVGQPALIAPCCLDVLRLTARVGAKTPGEQAARDVVSIVEGFTVVDGVPDHPHGDRGDAAPGRRDLATSRYKYEQFGEHLTHPHGELALAHQKRSESSRLRRPAVHRQSGRSRSFSVSLPELCFEDSRAAR
jgi:hypothetical protein